MSGDLVVTGSRVRRPSVSAERDQADALNSLPTREEAPAAPSWVMQDRAYRSFLSQLQSAVRANDRGAVVRLVGLPLRVDFAAGAKTYRTRREVERDYDRIFTPAVRQAILSLGTYELTSRDGGKLRGSGRIWFGCGLRTCSSDETVRVREITP